VLLEESTHESGGCRTQIQVQNSGMKILKRSYLR